MEEQSSQNHNQFPLSSKTIRRNSVSWMRPTSSNGIRSVIKEYYPLSWLSSAERKARKDAIYRHAITLQRLQHPLFAKVIDVCEWDENVIVTRVWVEGESYRQWMKKRAFINITSLHSILSDLTEAMTVAIENGFPLARLNPDDIIIDHEGNVILADYGLDLSAGNFSLGKYNVSLNQHRYQNGVQLLALFVYESLTGFISEGTPLPAVQTHYLPARVKHAINEAKHTHNVAPKAMNQFVERLYPPTTLALVRMAWKPATAMGLFGALATVGGYAFSQKDTPPPPTSVVIAQPAPLGANLSQEDISLLQLAIRRQGVAALIHPAIANIFHLTPNQYTLIEESLAQQRDQTVYMINNAASGQNIDVTNEMKVQREELQTRMLMIMTPSQRAFWETLNMETTDGEVPPL